jgi:outer membrane protein assembly factor BamE
MKHAPMKFLLPMVLATTLTACGTWWLPEPHKVPIQQGNVLSGEQVDQLEPGMTREQVRFLLGNPVLSHPFHPNRWDYVYSEAPAGTYPPARRLTLYFAGDKLTSVSDHYGRD